ncbi:unnamed protein product [Mesocestoides corti]|uniref:SWIM-type domain-containing protein n=1 Tax=Mesocestoides corti TaxID=53468 RepID=A0A0R3UJI9_MESCO|nr:unnamed protein product [Mesocestoides corti]
MIFKREISDIVIQHQEEALSTTMCILQKFGPMGFLIQEEHQDGKYKVLIGDPHSCTCKTYAKEKELCKHICWILLKKFKLNKNDPISWQSGLCERDISILLEKVSHMSSNQATDSSNMKMDNNVNTKVQQRTIGPNDICAICQDEFFKRQRFPVTFCRKGCGNSVHIKCMKMWKDHQPLKNHLDNSDIVSCPMCRGEFAKLEDLTHEVAFNRSLKIKKKKGSENGDGTSFHIFRSIEKPVKHEYICAICGCYPVIGRLYGMKSGDRRATIETISSTLCSKCFENQTADYAANSEIGQQVFFWKDKPSDKWLKVPQNFGLIAGFDRTIIANSEYGSVSEALTKTLCLVELGRITKWTIRPMRETLAEKTGNLMRSERPRGLLAPGRQCRICLMHFREEEEVRKLSGCNHIFHTKCIDQWLLHALVYLLIYFSCMIFACDSMTVHEAKSIIHI